MKRREFLKTAVTSAATLALPPGLLAAATGKPSDGKSRKPNIIFILSDDVGIGNIGCYGSDQFKTPRIDELADSGIRFGQCYSTPLCGPSRAQIMTGRYPFRTGMTSNRTGSLLQPANETMMAKVLKPAGYVTAHVGKWSQLPMGPGDWGFDEHLTFEGSGKYWSGQTPRYWLNGKEMPIGSKYLPDLMHDFVADFMTRHREQPFYLYYCMSHIHTPIVRTPDSRPGNKDEYKDNVDYMDKLVGKLVSQLDRIKLRDKTLVVFVGDNGTAPGWADRATIGGRALSGRKGTLLEGGSRVPMIVSWPGTAPAGKVNQDLIDFSDFFPTFAELAGADLPKGVTIDGQSFLPQVKGQTGKPREWAYVELNGKWYARDAHYKLNSDGQLFDLTDAPFVEKPVPSDTTDARAIESRKRLQAVLDKLNPAAGKQEGNKLPAKRNKNRRNRAQ